MASKNKKNKNAVGAGNMTDVPPVPEKDGGVENGEGIAENETGAVMLQDSDNPVDPIPYNLRRELEEIGKVRGFTAEEKIIELNRDIPALEAICNKANYPPRSWRDRWVE